jgi:hypothetical protein
MSRNRRDVQGGFLFGGPEAGVPTRVCKIPPSPIEKLIPNQSVLALTARTWALQNCMSLIPKTKTVPASGFEIRSDLFILNNMAEEWDCVPPDFRNHSNNGKIVVSLCNRRYF